MMLLVNGRNDHLSSFPNLNALDPLADYAIRHRRAMHRAYYAEPIEAFVGRTTDEILGAMVRAGSFSLETTQRDAWLDEVRILQGAVAPYRGRGKVYLEYSVPRLGQRIDAVLIIDHVVFVVEFKVGEREFKSHAVDQVWDYSLDLKNFHETSHSKAVVPILVATAASRGSAELCVTPDDDGLVRPLHSSPRELGEVLQKALACCQGQPVDPEEWERGRYCPTPTIVEAAKALYGGHDVADISRNDAAAINLGRTTEAISAIIRESRENSLKSICFVTGVPGAGKTLVGLNIATKHIDRNDALYSVFLSGNGPLVAVLREALVRDKVRREVESGRRIKKGTALSEVKLFIQNVHHFRDECLIDEHRPPLEHVALFDEAQRAWNVEQTAKFMRQKRRVPGFTKSEPEFLISCMDRHQDWAVVVCLVGGGQEINTGEAGMREWIASLERSFPSWNAHLSPQLHGDEYGSADLLRVLAGRRKLYYNEDLHLSVSMRSFRSEAVSALVNALLDCQEREVQKLLRMAARRYPIAITRKLETAKAWLRSHARGSERYGMLVSSQALRLKPHAIDVRAPLDPVHWFLNEKSDVRSSYYLEDAATEFHVQGLELDWACVVWDADFRYDPSGWGHFSFIGDRWNQIRKPERQLHLKNAYLVLLTRARQGMVIVVPPGESHDPTRAPAFYDPTFEYLRRLGLPQI